MKRAVFLDRDGVLNEPLVRDGKPYPPRDPGEFRIRSEAAAALGRLKDRGFLLIVVTNQPDVARGAQQRSAVEEMNRSLVAALPLDDCLVCWHDDADGCRCRKPRPGLLLQAAERFGIDLTRSFLIGDRWRDIDAGSAAGCRTVLIDLGYRERPPSNAPDAKVASLDAAAAWILAHDVPALATLRVKLFADSADRTGILRLARNPLIRGFTTNPTLMRKAGVADYERFAREILAEIPDRPVSFDVMADEFPEMERNAREIAAWGENVYVKIPVTTTGGESTAEVVRRLAYSGVQVNVTALLSVAQVRAVAAAAGGGAPCCISVFAGRIADTGRDPVPLMAEGARIARQWPNLELIWASPRELLNVFQADAAGCHIITATSDILNKLGLVGKDLDEYSLETVRMFRDDACKSGFVVVTGEN
jgi:transaldolase